LNLVQKVALAAVGVTTALTTPGSLSTSARGASEIKWWEVNTRNRKLVKYYYMRASQLNVSIQKLVTVSLILF
jgi:hypothetical protein